MNMFNNKQTDKNTRDIADCRDSLVGIRNAICDEIKHLTKQHDNLCDEIVATKKRIDKIFAMIEASNHPVAAKDIKQSKRELIKSVIQNLKSCTIKNIKQKAEGCSRVTIEKYLKEFKAQGLIEIVVPIKNGQAKIIRWMTP
jgi:response regulator of citrate/malate metabolism